MNRDLKILSLLHILNDGYRTTAVTILPFIAKDLSLNLTTVGVLGSSQTFIGTLLAVPSGYLAAKIGGFKLLLTSLILYSLGFVGISFSPHFLFIFLAFYLGAIGFAFFHPVSFALVTRLSEPAHRGKNMGNFMSLGDIGRMIIPSLALAAIPYIGWRMFMCIAAIVGFGIYAISRLYLRKEIRPEENKVAPDLGKRVWLKSSLLLLKEKHFRQTLFAAVGDTLASSNIYIYLPFLLLSRGIAATQLVLFTSAFFFGSLSGKALLGRGVDLYGNKKMFIFSEIAMAVTLLFLAVFHQFFIMLLISYILGLFTKGTSPVVQTLVSESIHESQYEKAFGTSETIIQMAGAFTIFISGILADLFGLSAVFYWSTGLALLATLPIIFYRKPHF